MLGLFNKYYSHYRRSSFHENIIDKTREEVKEMSQEVISSLSQEIERLEKNKNEKIDNIKNQLKKIEEENVHLKRKITAMQKQIELDTKRGNTANISMYERNITNYNEDLNVLQVESNKLVQEQRTIEEEFIKKISRQRHEISMARRNSN